MFTPIEVKALPNYRLWLRYADGVAGEVNLSHLAGRGVFTLWNDPGEFERVHVGPLGNIAWTDDIDICPDALYMEITGKTPEELFPALLPKVVNAWAALHQDELNMCWNKAADLQQPGKIDPLK